MNNQYSREALVEFLDYAGSKGLLNTSTARARRIAVKRVFEILEPHEAQDITSIDLDEVMRRFSNLEGSAFTPDSLVTYRSRIRSAVEDFKRYKQDPISFKPAIPNSSNKKANSAKPERSSSSRRRTEHRVVDPTPTPQPNSLPIPLRADLTVFLHGIPFDLTKAEAKRIANVVLAMAMETEE